MGYHIFRLPPLNLQSVTEFSELSFLGMLSANDFQYAMYKEIEGVTVA